MAALDGARVIGRVAVDRAIRLVPGRSCAGTPPAPSTAPPASAGLRCARCDTLVCDATRLRLFHGMVLRCPGCGEPRRVA